ncbi:MAG: protein kinase [Chloroflexi bacterium]|nr:protein kinase [Chloroflexota bacterium]
MNRRYNLLEKLGTGGMGEVYRAYDRLSGQHVALKRVLFEQDSDSELRLALTHEFKTLASLRHPNIINVLDYGFDDTGLPFYAMEYLEGHQTILQAAENLSEEAKIDLVIQLLQGLAYLHRRGLLHRDLKPSNVLVVNRSVRLIDFGLVAKPEQSYGPAGTFAYMPPEIFTGMGASEASDLYSAGLIAYAILTGHHPFDTDQEPRALISEILNVEPDLSMIPGHLQPVVKRLLAKFPEDRYSSAIKVIGAIHNIYNRTIPLRTSAILDSHLQTATFVGRQTELGRLLDAMAELAHQHAGSAWLVGGESGVGKSRLLEELRIQALVEGIPVLVGQAIDEGSVPYQLWLNVLPHLLLRVEVGDSEAAVLKPIVPRINDILERDIGELPRDLDGHFLLHETILNLFRRHEGPLLLLLDDLHWANMEVLQRLLDNDLPLMIVGTYRDDDKSTLPSEVPAMTLMKLDRLGPDAVAELSRAMIGDAGERPGVLELLQNETEGNAFFIVEAVRALAEDAGEWYDVGHKTLPSSIMTGGIETVLTRRLQRIPTHHRELLELAAVQGRVFDTALLRFIHDIDVPEFLQAGVDAAVFEVFDDHYRFAHDKLRDKVLSDLAPHDRARHHRTMGDALVAAYPDALNEHAVEIAHHYEMAYRDGVTNVDVGHYLFEAGKRMARSYENDVAVDYFSRALEYIYDPQRQFEVLSERCAVFALVGNRAAQAQDLTSMGAVARHSEQHAAVHLNWAYYNFDMSDYPRVIEHAQAAVEHARSAADTIQEAQGLAIWGFTLHALGQGDSALELVDNARERIETTNDMLTRARVYSHLARLWQSRGNADLEEHYLHLALEIYEEQGDIRGRARSMNALAFMVGRGGAYEQEYAYFLKALELFRQIGDKDWEVNLLGNLGVWHTERGQVDTAAPYFEEALELAQQLGDDDAVAWTLLEQGTLFFAQGRYSQAARNFERGGVMYRALGRTIPHGYALALAGLLAIRTGQIDNGIMYLDELAAFQSPWLEWYYLTGYAEYALLINDPELALDYLKQASSMAESSLLKGAYHNHYLGITFTKMGQAGLARQYLEQARLQYEQAGRPAHMIEALAGLVALGRHKHMGEVLEFLKACPEVNGAHYPLRVYSMLYEAMAETGDRRADAVLAQGYARLMAVARHFDDEVARQHFFENIPCHQTILTAIRV